MKRLFKIILVFILFFIFIFNVNASTKTYERNESNNYGIKKDIKLNNDRINSALNVPLVDASEKIYDFADVLTDFEEESLYNVMEKYISNTGMDIIFISYDLPLTDSQNDEYSKDFYDYNDFGYDLDEYYSGSVLFLNVNENDPYFGSSDFGIAQLYINEDRANKILDDVYISFKNKKYYEGISSFVSAMNVYYNRGVVDKNEYIDSNGFVRQKKSGLIFKALCISVPISGIITLIIMLILVSKNKMIKIAYNASEYLNKESISFSDKRDVFISTHTTSYTSSSSSSGGGSSSGSRSHSGSSGRGSSSRGRHL